MRNCRKNRQLRIFNFCQLNLRFAHIEKKQYLCTENVIFDGKNISENVIFYTGNIYKM